jgi:hypothetical protein
VEARKFAVGDQVRLLLDNYANDSPADVYTISRALPAMANVWEYRVKRVGDGQERAVSEQQLSKGPVLEIWQTPLRQKRNRMPRGFATPAPPHERG